VTQRGACGGELAAAGHRLVIVTRTLTVSRHAVYRVPRSRQAPSAARREPVDEVEWAIVAVAEQTPTEGANG
jgi:hypothetical protein